MITTLRDYVYIIVLLLALAVTGYIEINKLLVRVSERTIAQVRVRR